MHAKQFASSIHVTGEKVEVAEGGAAQQAGEVLLASVPPQLPIKYLQVQANTSLSLCFPSSQPLV